MYLTYILLWQQQYLYQLWYKWFDCIFDVHKNLWACILTVRMVSVCLCLVKWQSNTHVSEFLSYQMFRKYYQKLRLFLIQNELKIIHLWIVIGKELNYHFILFKLSLKHDYRNEHCGTAKLVENISNFRLAVAED